MADFKNEDTGEVRRARGYNSESCLWTFHSIHDPRTIRSFQHLESLYSDPKRILPHDLVINEVTMKALIEQRRLTNQQALGSAYLKRIDSFTTDGTPMSTLSRLSDLLGTTSSESIKAPPRESFNFKSLGPSKRFSLMEEGDVGTFVCLICLQSVL